MEGKTLHWFSKNMKIKSLCSRIPKEDKALKSYIKNTFGFSPKNIHLYKQAFLHKSVSIENKENGYSTNNERLEYLGDAVLGAVVADFLYKKYPLSDEGFLTELRSRILNRNQLNKLSRKLGLDLFIKTKDCNLFVCESIIGDTFEAFIGTIYLDYGYDFAKKIMLEKIIMAHLDIESLAKTNTNYKGKLLAWSQKVKNKVEYKVSDEIIINNRKQYVVKLYIEEQLVSEGCDYTIKAAEQNAAMHACEILEL